MQTTVTMNKRYNILWIDDQYEELIDFSIQAENAGIDLFGFTSFEEGFKYLEKDLNQYDGVLLDAMFFETKEQVKGEEDESGLGMAIARLNELKFKKDLPWFVLSGKESFTKNNNSILKANKKRCFDKTDGDDLEELLITIKEEADKLEDTQIKHRYQNVFAVLTGTYIGEEPADHLLKILKSVGNPGEGIEDVLYFNRLRIILEGIFRAANKFGLLHDHCIQGGKVNLKNSFDFLSQQKVKVSHDKIVTCDRKHFPALIERAVENILDVTNVASHSESPEKEKSRLELSAYRQTVRSPYLLYCLTFQLMDVLLWFRSYIDENKDYRSNVAFWKTAAITNEVVHTGAIEQDENRNYFCGEYILNYIYTDQNFKLGDEIAILEASDNTNPRTQNIYKYYANRFSKA